MTGQQEFIKDLEKQFGFDKSPSERFLIMVKNYLTFDFGESYFRSISVIDLVIEKMPVSITLGLWSTLIAYLVSIPLGIRKAVNDGSSFDTISSGIIIICYSLPGFLFAIILLVFFAGGSYYQIFPMRGLTSDNWSNLSFFGKIFDYLWHITLPVLASTIGSFATLTLLTKNFLTKHKFSIIDNNGKILKKIDEKPTTFVNYGIGVYIFNKKILSSLKFSDIS